MANSELATCKSVWIPQGFKRMRVQLQPVNSVDEMGTLAVDTQPSEFVTAGYGPPTSPRLAPGYSFWQPSFTAVAPMSTPKAFLTIRSTKFTADGLQRGRCRQRQCTPGNGYRRQMSRKKRSNSASVEYNYWRIQGRGRQGSLYSIQESGFCEKRGDF